MSDIHSLRTHKEDEAELTKLFAFLFLVIAAGCAVTAYGLLVQ